jgi:hypothetical protein
VDTVGATLSAALARTWRLLAKMSYLANEPEDGAHLPTSATKIAVNGTRDPSPRVPPVVQRALLRRIH